MHGLHTADRHIQPQFDSPPADASIDLASIPFGRAPFGNYCRFARSAFSGVFDHRMKCKSAQFGGRANIEFAFEVFAVGVDGVCAEHKLIGNGTRR